MKPVVVKFRTFSSADSRIPESLRPFPLLKLHRPDWTLTLPNDEDGVAAAIRNYVP